MRKNNLNNKPDAEPAWAEIARALFASGSLDRRSARFFLSVAMGKANRRRGDR